MSRLAWQVTVVIPHHAGESILLRCLESLQGEGCEIVVVDNGSTDGSVEAVLRVYPTFRVVRSPKNLGFAGGCNLGIRASRTPYVALLNDDAVATDGWLEPLVRRIASDERIAAVQPKILSLANPTHFDYAGGAGGEIDLFGYPFARGRLFDVVEADTGQYDTPSRIFWASGAAVLFRRMALERVGLFDESFFAHMEEIDLEWRLQKAGYRIVSEPRSIVYHQGAATLGSTQTRKMVLNYTNNLVLLLKNLEWETLAFVFPMRVFLDAVTLLWSFCRLDLRRTWAVCAGYFGLCLKGKAVLRGRALVRGLSVVPDRILYRRMYRGSAALARYVGGVKEARRLLPREDP